VDKHPDKQEIILTAELPFAGKIALVTGSGRGIGRAIALHFAQNGADLVVNFFRNRAPAEETATVIQASAVEPCWSKQTLARMKDWTIFSMKSKKTSGGWIS